MNEPLKKHLCVCRDKVYVLKKDRPSIGKEVGDYYNGEFAESIEELIAKGVIEEEIAPEEKKEELKSHLLSLVDESFDGFAGRLEKDLWNNFVSHPDGVWNMELARLDLPEYIPLTVENVEKWIAAREETQKEKLKNLIASADFSKFGGEK